MAIKAAEYRGGNRTKLVIIAVIMLGEKTFKSKPEREKLTCSYRMFKA